MKCDSLPKVNMGFQNLDGNAFSILARFSVSAKKQGWDKESVNEVTSLAMSGDYNNLLTTIMKYTEDVYIEEEEEDYE